MQPSSSRTSAVPSPLGTIARRLGRPQRATIARRHLPLAVSSIYIGRGSRKFGLDASDWANPFVIGTRGSRDDVIAKFRIHLLDDSELHLRLHELAGCTLLCHCGPKDPCHADILIRAFVDLHEPENASDGPTSEEDELGDVKPILGAGWLGNGPPLSVGAGARRRDMQDGGGLCSPGLWPPGKRKVPPRGTFVSRRDQRCH